MAGAEQRLDGDLVLHSVTTQEDEKRFAAFQSTVNRIESMTAANLLARHPGTRRDEFLIIEDTSTREVVSSSCLIPWGMRYHGVELSCAQVELILTHPRYRKRGLVRAQFRRLHELVAEKKYDVVIIWGIPYYYRQFGYGYCLDGSAFQSLPAWRVGDGGALSESGYRMREAQVQDIPALGALYEKIVCGLGVSLARPPEHWRYLIEAARFPIHVFESADGKRVAGYSIHTRFKKMVHVFESGIEDQDVAMAFLRELKKDAEEIQVNWPRTQTLVRLAESLGSITVRSTQWLISLPDVRGFLLKVRPVLDRRLASSEFAGMTKEFVLNLFREGYRIRFQSGAIQSVERAGFVDASMGAEGGNLNIPPDAFLRLVFGQSSLDELYAAWPDIVCRAEDRPLVDTLFPKANAYLYTPYHYYGPEMYTLEEKFLRYYV